MALPEDPRVVPSTDIRHFITKHSYLLLRKALAPLTSVGVCTHEYIFHTNTHAYTQLKVVK